MEFLEPELDPTVIVFRDALFFMLFSLVVVIFLLAFLIGGAAQKEQTLPMRAEIEIEALWPIGTQYDVDLWVMGPDGVPIGWSTRAHTANFNLERDDKGGEDDAAKINYESITVRRRVPGEYVVNLHMFNAHGEPLPLPVIVSVIGKGDAGTIFSGSVTLERRFHEVTVIRFSVDPEGRILSDSLSDRYREVVPVGSSYMRGKPMEFHPRAPTDWPAWAGERPGAGKP